MRQLPCFLRQLLGLDHAAARTRSDEARVAEERTVKAEQRRQTTDLVLVERPEHAVACMLAVGPEHDELRDERVIVAAHLRSHLDARVDAHARAGRLAIARDPPGSWEESLGGILGVDAALDGVAAERHVLLRDR